jgi:thioredoxin:protein disulfide reductase
MKPIVKTLILLFSVQALFLNQIWSNPQDNESKIIKSDSNTGTLIEAEDPSTDVVTIKDHQIRFLDNNKIEFNVLVHDGFFSYLEKFELQIQGLSVSNLEFDPIVTFYDKTFNKNKQGLKNSAIGKAIIALENGSHNFKEGQELKITLHYQACTPEYCLFPSTYEFSQALSKQEAQSINKLNTPGWMNQGLFYSLIFIFFTGLLTSLTPCVYPLIPITIAVLGRDKSDTKKQGFLKSSIYVLGMAVTYSALGMLAATSGFMFGSLLSNIYFLVFLSFILFIAALSMFDILEIKSPQFLNNHSGKTNKSNLGIFASGAFSGLVVGPCVGPVLVGILSYVSMTKDLITGFSYMFTFALGLGSLIIVLGTFSGLMDKIPRSGAWMIWVKKSLGFVFLLMIGYFLRPILDIKDLVTTVSLLFFIFSAIIVYKSEITKPSFELSVLKAVAIFSLLISLSSVALNKERFERFVGYNSSTYANTKWDVFSEEKLEQAKKNGHPVILDFYAEWCAACKELKHITFADQRVIDFSADIEWLYFDSTKSTPKLDEYKKKYSIMGLPTILFFDKFGNLRSDLTLTGFEKPDDFLKRLNKL